jgi:YHS domain-containing protein
MKATVLRTLVATPLLAVLSLAAWAAPVQFTPPQQEAVNKLTAKGGLVMQLAADSDALVVNLSLAGKQATDAELAEVKNLPKVAQLNLANTAVTDAGLANVEGLTDLTSLHLEKTAVTDAGLAHLAKLSKLEYLNLYNTAVTDAGVEKLSGLKGLKRVYLWQTKVTDAGAGSLKKAAPGVTVNRGEELAIVVKPAETQPAAKPADKDKDKKPAAAAASAVTAAPAGAKPVNSVCPVSGKPVVAENVLLYEGKVVGFCCDKCPKAFTKDPAKYAANIKSDVKADIAAATANQDKKAEEKKADDKKPQAKPDAKTDEKKGEEKKAAAADDKKPAVVDAKPVNTKCPLSGEEIEAGFTAVFDGKTVGFCCDKCQAKFNADPKKYADKIVADAKK